MSSRHSCISKSCTAKKNKMSFQFFYLLDGVHPVPTERDRWAKVISTAVQLCKKRSGCEQRAAEEEEKQRDRRLVVFGESGGEEDEEETSRFNYKLQSKRF